jgi:hypothetical protein
MFNKPLEWTGHQLSPAFDLKSLPATQGQRYTELKEARACQLDWAGPEFGTFPI